MASGMDMEGDGSDAVCELVPAQGPALLDFGLCVVQGSETPIGRCGNTGIHRRCDATFLSWCNDQGGDVEACEEPQLYADTNMVPCGTGPNAALCDLPFKDNCDAIDGEIVCYSRSCDVGACALPPLEPVICCAKGMGLDGQGCDPVDAATCGPDDFVLNCGVFPWSCTVNDDPPPNAPGKHDCSCHLPRRRAL